MYSWTTKNLMTKIYYNFMGNISELFKKHSYVVISGNYKK